MIIFFSPHRDYKFLIGHYFWLGNNIYQIDAIDMFKWSESTGSVSAGSTSTYDFDSYLKPLDGYAYFITHMGIDGKNGFAVQFPKGIVHGAPRGETEYIYRSEAPKTDPYYYPMVVTPPNYPTWALNNPDASNAHTAYAHFFGRRWLIHRLSIEDRNPEIERKATKLTDYANNSIGQG